MSGRWLSIIGIGEEGRSGLSPAAGALIDAAELVVGGKRHLELVGPTAGRHLAWATPLESTIPQILQFRGTPVAVIASGDPFWFGAGVTMARQIPVEEMLVVPSPSCFSLAAARLGWALQDTVTLGLNMKGLTPLLRRHLHDGRRILALSLNSETPREVAALLTMFGFGKSRMTVLEALGGPRERIRHASAAGFDLGSIDPLNVIAIEVQGGASAKPIPFTSGLPDDYFDTDGQLTKREIRAITLSSLAPGAGELLWDIGAGSGSIGIEWMLAHAANRAVALERDPRRAARAAENAIALGVPQLDVRIGAAPEALAGLPEPDAVFIGGGANLENVIETCWAILKPQGRVVVNSVTLETESRLIAAHREFGGTLTRIGIDRADQVGSRLAWRPAMPVLQWAARKHAA